MIFFCPASCIYVSFLIQILVFNMVNQKVPKTIFVALLARNKEHTLPYFLSHFENLTYPKNRISLFIRSDHNTDKTNLILQKWIDQYRSEYNSVDNILSDNHLTNSADENFPAKWTDERHDRVMNMKEMALNKARNMFADYILFLDLDVFITDREILEKLIEEDKPIVSPMLDSLETYSNFWGAMTDDYCYRRSDDYISIVEREKKGCFDVPLVHGFVLIDLYRNNFDQLSFLIENIQINTGPEVPQDNMISLAVSAKLTNMSMFVCNRENFGFILPPLDATDPLNKDFNQLSDIRLAALNGIEGLFVSDTLKQFEMQNPGKTKLGFDRIYVINLSQRVERKRKMQKCLDILGIEAEIFNAVDGTSLNSTYLKDKGIKQLNIYKDRFLNTNMKYGEIGCFLSHYSIWEDIVNNRYEKVIILEDDARLEPNFKNSLDDMMNEIQNINLSWDLLYLARHRLKQSGQTEKIVDGTEKLLHVSFSIWALAYILNLRGAEKLLKPQPLSKVLPVDEYFPIMYNMHTKEEYMAEYFPRDLKAFSISPCIVYPRYDEGDDQYISDTQAGEIIPVEYELPSVNQAEPFLKSDL